MEFTQGLHRAVQQRPDAIASVCAGREISFATLQDRVARMAGGLRQLGVCNCDRVAMLSLNSDHYLSYYLAVPWAGAVVNPVNFRWSLNEICDSLQDSQTVALFIDDHFAEHSDKLLDRCTFLRVLVFTGSGQCPPEAVPLEQLIADNEPIDDAGIGGDELFGIFYTGGTTGRAKGVMLSHRNICSSGLALMAEGAFPDGAVGLHAAPMFHLADLMLTTGLLLGGGRHVMLSHFKPERALTLIQEQGISDLLLVPAMLQALVDFPGLSEYDTGGVKRIYYGASPASESLLDRTMAAFPQAGLTQVYGMTEMAAVMTVLPPAAHAHRRLLRSGGRASVHVQVRVVDQDGKPVAPGEVGEIVARGPNTMLGYLDQPDATAEALRDGWMRTGDLGTMDENGYLFIVDRAKDMIISGGENVYCAEVENAIAQHPAVATCAVIGIPSEQWGEAVHAVVVLKDGDTLTAEGLAEHCKTLIAGYKCPRSLEVVDTLPLSGANKVLKSELRAPHWEDRETQLG
ncbi:MAG: long-chain fatty acid--CoA ligase [Salinisphaera sp.]|nr:long-chain fatty acid--CoA ligase [Salinisphaera sp.]